MKLSGFANKHLKPSHETYEPYNSSGHTVPGPTGHFITRPGQTSVPPGNSPCVNLMVSGSLSSMLVDNTGTEPLARNSNGRT